VFVLGNGYNIVLATKPAIEASAIALEGAAIPLRAAAGDLA
jgi:hypothetical protein